MPERCFSDAFWRRFDRFLIGLWPLFGRLLSGFFGGFKPVFGRFSQARWAVFLDFHPQARGSAEVFTAKKIFYFAPLPFQLLICCYSPTLAAQSDFSPRLIILNPFTRISPALADASYDPVPSQALPLLSPSALSPTAWLLLPASTARSSPSSLSPPDLPIFFFLSYHCDHCGLALDMRWMGIGCVCWMGYEWAADGRRLCGGWVLDGRWMGSRWADRWETGCG